MVRNYHRKKERISDDVIVNALLAIRTGSSFRAAARDYGVSVRSLYRHFNKNVSSVEATSSTSNTRRSLPVDVIINSVGGKTIFGPEQEKELATNIYDGVSLQQLRKLAYEYAKKNGISYPDAWDVHCEASRDWQIGFMKRHPKLSLRKLENIFTKEEEQTLEDFMMYSCEVYFGLSFSEARTLAYEYALELKVNIPASWAKNKCAGPDWLEKYLIRHPTLSKHLTDSANLTRSSTFNRSNVNLFFNNYDKVFENTIFEPQDIWNVDEMELSTIVTPNQHDPITTEERGSVVSMVLAVNAMGMRAPPCLIFPRDRFEHYFLNGGPVGCSGAANPAGYVNSENFLYFIQKFQAYTRSWPGSPILLILDNCISHRTFEVIKFCREKGIYLLSFPPNTSHRLQPLEVGVFGPVKQAANQLCKDWIKSHPGRIMDPFDLSPIFSRALELGATERNIKTGFQASGIWPLERQIFQDIDFVTSSTTDPAKPDVKVNGEQILPDNNFISTSTIYQTDIIEGIESYEGNMLMPEDLQFKEEADEFYTD